MFASMSEILTKMNFCFIFRLVAVKEHHVVASFHCCCTAKIRNPSIVITK